MSLLTLLLGILSALAPIAGVNLPEPSPEAAVLPARELVLEPQCEGELTGLEEERMMAAIQYRCELVGLRGVQVRREGRNFLVQVNSGLIPTMEEYAETLDELESILNERTNMQLLRVHPDSEILVRDGEVQELLVEYETAVVAYEEHPGEIEVAPQIPALPARLRLPGYMLAEHRVVSPEDGSGYYEYMVVQRPETAAEEELLVTELEVDRASMDALRGSIDVELTARGGETLTRLTRSMQLGKDRLAILLNGTIVCAPVVHAELGCSFFISGQDREVNERVVDGLSMPLPVQVRVIERRGVE